MARLLMSPDGRRAANVYPQDLANPLYAGWDDMTDMDDKALQLIAAGRQIMAEAAATIAHI
jgi:hypothetical protein